MKPTRTTLLANFAYIIGGFNASEKSYGRLEMHVRNIDDDKEVVDYLLKEYKDDVTKNLIEENTKLKAKLYEIQKK